VSSDDQPRYQNRNGGISTNALGVFDPDLNFIYVLTRWEGSASDSLVLQDALYRNNHFIIPNDNLLTQILY
jgi:hypothetical protein